MRKSSSPRPGSSKGAFDMRRRVKPGDIISAKLQVLRVGRNREDTADVITVRIPGFATPVTATAVYLLGEDQD